MRSVESSRVVLLNLFLLNSFLPATSVREGGVKGSSFLVEIAGQGLRLPLKHLQSKECESAESQISKNKHPFENRQPAKACTEFVKPHCH